MASRTVYTVAFAFFTSWNIMQPIKASYNDYQTPLEIACLGAGIAATAYGITWATACYHFHTAVRKYTPEVDMLLRAEYNPNVIAEELISYILRKHHQEGNVWFGNPHGYYKNYPLLKYKNNLSYYITALSLLKFFVGSEKRARIDMLVARLQRILDYLITDYRLIKEEREFELFYLKKSKYITAHH